MIRSRFTAWFVRTPTYPWLLASLPALQLMAHNSSQIGLDEVLRPLVASWALTTIGYLLLALLLKDRHRAALLVSLLLVLFFSYGHIYETLRGTSLFGFNIGRHRYLTLGYLLVLILGTWLSIRRGSGIKALTPWVNVFGILILVAPLYRIADYQLKLSRSVSGSELSGAVVGPRERENLPDVYYVILDGYTRGDALLEDLEYDNSEFLSGLQGLGFYVAECSRSNYYHTESSLNSSLNMEYMPTIRARLAERGQDPDSAFTLIKDSAVRKVLEDLGYKTVAFQTGYGWTDWRDADVYLSAARRPLDLRHFNAFEVLFIETTAVRLWLDTRYVLALAEDFDVGIRYGGHIELQMNILDQLPGVSALPQPTFTFAHILIPHHPYVFGPEGEILTDPGYYGGDASTPINDRYLRIGYTGEVEFVSARILDIVAGLIETSSQPPIVILQGDHGLRHDNRFEIFNAYYFPGDPADSLYPSITPVNTFRLMLDEYFGTSLGLLADISIYEGKDERVPETSETCSSNE